MKNKKLIPLFTFALLFCCLALAAPANTEAKTVKLNNSKKVTKASMKMKVGQKKKIKLKNVKSSQKIKWKSSNSKVVKIKKRTGNTVTIKAKKKGTATVTAKIGKKKVKVKVKVKGWPTTESDLMAVGFKEWLDYPYDTKHHIKWTTSNPDVVEIVKTSKERAKIECLKEGTATVKAKAGKKSYTYKITVLSELDYALHCDWRSGSFKKKTKKIVKEVLGSNLSKYTDAQKCYKLAMWECEYMTYQSGNHSGETALSNGGYGVCEAYMELYDSLLREAGVSTLMIICPSLNHGWNLVILDGECYQCDITWMDNSNVAGINKKMETRFLCSDSKFVQGRPSDAYIIYGGMKVPKCTSTKYDDKKYLIGQSETGSKIEITEEEYEAADGDSNPYYSKKGTDPIKYYAYIDYTSNIFTRGEV